MARYFRLDVIREILNTGVLPLFYVDETELAVDIINACYQGGVRTIEFTNRGEMAYPVFADLVKHFSKTNPEIILGVGSVIDAPTAALFLAGGANFIVGPNLNPEIARLCNRRKILYLPGCATENEIAAAEELGAEICKIFPGESVGGPAFVNAVMAPCPWHRLLPTGGVDATEKSITEWIKAGAAAVGLGSKLLSKQAFKDRDYTGIQTKTSDCVRWIRAARNVPVFLGVEHVGLYASKNSAAELSAWYENLFGMNRKEGISSFFVSSQGSGRLEFPKEPADATVHIAIQVSDFDKAVSLLQEKGVGLSSVVSKADVKSGYLDVKDPEGNLIHLLWQARK
jgi:2-dehydro-3-deoxyphosphogluconate aldolase/(4S)-4-hydroxy-2-oxoglutarate aldolase